MPRFAPRTAHRPAELSLPSGGPLAASPAGACWFLTSHSIRDEGNIYSMCARLIPHQPAGSRSSLNGSKGSPADVNSSSASYRVLGSGRKPSGERPWLSVDRKVAGRNASAPIEPRQILNRVWMPSQYLNGEGNTWLLLGELRSTGVRVDSMLPRLMEREPRKSGASQVEMDVKVFDKGVIPRRISIPTPDLRWPHSSEEVG